MRKLKPILLIVSMCNILFAQSKAKLRPHYINLSFSSQELKMGELGNPLSDYGAAFTVGRTYYICKKSPILNMIRFGIDATWIDLNYSNYKFENKYGYDGGNFEWLTENIHQAEIGMQGGQSITITPVKRLSIHGYFRYAPSFSALFDGGDFKGSYGSFFVTGANVSYSVIGVGIEKRWGQANYKSFIDIEGYGSSEKVSDKLKTSGFRAYLTFRF